MERTYTVDELVAAVRRRWKVAAIVSGRDRKSTRLNSSHQIISYPAFCLKKKKEALNLSFSAGRFDWIETAFFIQFFSPEEKVALVRHIHTVLKPGGRITTTALMQRNQSFYP